MSNTPPAGELDKANSTTMVTVGCKLPNGLIIELGKRGDSGYVMVRLNGANSSQLVGGYGLTQVSKEVWDAWEKKNKHLSFVRKKLVFAQGSIASATDYATDLKLLKSGLERLDPHAGLLGADGKPLVTVDENHFKQGTRDVADARNAAFA